MMNSPCTRLDAPETRQRAFLRQAMPWVGAVALVALYAVFGGL